MRLKDIVFKSRKVNRAFAWAAHIFTAAGLIFGFLGLIAILNGEQTLAFLFMGFLHDEQRRRNLAKGFI